ncbi:MAG: hypothetical protein HRT38_12135 [Alteromonadaceae bacterium]|nr:hypothetical protein [Alteromonadaceae bacterium]
MKKITSKALSIGLLLLLSCGSVATTIIKIEPCTYKPILNSAESPPYTSLMTCKLPQHITSFRLTTPKLTPLKNCKLIEERLEPISKYPLYAPSVNGICPNHNSGLYVPMVYGSEVFNNDEVFNQILKLTSDLERNGVFARDRMDIPFYEFWFCEQCHKFLDSINTGVPIAVRSLNMNYSDTNAATISIKVNDERWNLSLLMLDNEFFIKQVNRIQ